jgi:hypothetical protein
MPSRFSTGHHALRIDLGRAEKAAGVARDVRSICDSPGEDRAHRSHRRIPRQAVYI